MMIRDYIRALVREPGASLPTAKLIQDRVMFEYRNKGFVFVTTPPRNGHAIAMENLAQFKAVNLHPGILFDILSRRTYHVPTFQTFLGVLADPAEPFASLGDLQDPINFRHTFTFEERSFVDNWLQTRYGACPNARPAIKRDSLRHDCVIANEKCSALVTSCDELTEQQLYQFAGHANFTFGFLNGTKHERYQTHWGNFYKQKLFPPRLYMGVGTSEFGSNEVPVTSPELEAMALRVLGSAVALPPPAVTVPDPLVRLATKLGVTLLQRHDMRYFVIRP